MTASKHKVLTIADVSVLGEALIAVADRYPLQFRTERDFFPLVVTYLHGRVPGVATEVGKSNKKIDFRVGGMNPGVLELAVAPRALEDPNNPTQKFPGQQAAPQLYASQNKPELAKLTAVPTTQAKTRFLLLLDFRGNHDYESLKEGYEKQLPPGGGGSVVRVVYVKRGSPVKHFRLGGKKKSKTTGKKK